MPAGSSPKRERQYQHIKAGAKKRGESGQRAEEIAARTVNVAGRSKMTKAELEEAVGR